MNKKKFIELNIAATPHDSKDVYWNLFQVAAMKNVRYSTGGEKIARISEASRVPNHENLFIGHLSTWVDIHENKNWTNIASEELLTDEERQTTISNIPETHVPGYKRFDYVFNIQNHRLYIEKKNYKQQTIMPNQIRSIFEKLMSGEIQGNESPEVEVTIIPKEDTVDNILNLPGLKKLEISIVRPNPDGTDDDDLQKVLNKMKNQNASKSTIILQKDKKEQKLLPDTETRNLARIGSENGFVRGETVDETGKSEKISTKDTPKIIQIEWKSDETLLQKLNKIVHFW